MKLKSTGVVVSILILIIMMLICHTMNFFYPKNKFKNISKNNNNSDETPKEKDYNEIYYTNDSDIKDLCAIANQAEIPCDIIKQCEPEPEPKLLGLDSLSNSELAVLYKFAYEASAREIFIRTLQDRKPTTTKPLTTRPITTKPSSR